jgi:hypothetical protein
MEEHFVSSPALGPILGCVRLRRSMLAVVVHDQQFHHCEEGAVFGLGKRLNSFGGLACTACS